MDKFRCAKLVLDSLHFFNDVVMNRMSVAICSILGKLFTTFYILFMSCNYICLLKRYVSSTFVFCIFKGQYILS